LIIYVFLLKDETPKQNLKYIRMQNKSRFKLPFGKKNPQSQKTVSAARVSKTPQISHHGLSYAGQHLLLLIQHQVDAQNIKVPAAQNSWSVLVELNQDVQLEEAKKRAKELCGIHHFSPHELEEIAHRVTKFVMMIQPDLVV
jgi:hypothetical protein